MALRIETNAEPIPGYRLLERLGAGGFGEVWKAEAPGGLLKAIKIVRGDGRSHDDGGGLAEQELKALRRVQSVRHPYLLSIDRYDVIEGHLLIVTELADGSLWDRWLAQRRANEPGLPRESLIRYLSEAAEVLDLMHTKHRLQHLDIKPQNLFLIHDHVKVADFGLVKDLHGVQGVITGGVTPFYAAPETFNDVVSQHCDQYSLAIVYCELLTGERPFAGGSAQMVMVQHLQHEPNLEQLPEGDRSAVAKALAKSPADRFPSCVDFVRALGLANSGHGPLPLHEERITADDSIDFEVAADTECREQATECTGSRRMSPTLVLGLGGVGGMVLLRLRSTLLERGCDLSGIRLLYVDTDGDALIDAQAGDSGLSGDEEFHIPLRRPAHYLKPGRDGRLATDGWLDTHLLNRLAREQLTQGVRALGRLAFVDHERALTHAVTERVRAVAASSKAVAGFQATQVLVVASMAGGTGSGAYIDIASLAQQVLKRNGSSADNLHGWLLVPPIRRGSPAEVRATANACASLREIQLQNRPVLDSLGFKPDEIVSGAPFATLTVLPMGASESPEQMDGIDVAVNVLARELVTTSHPWPSDNHADLSQLPSPLYRTFGAVQFSWPRNAILDRAAIRTSQAMIGHWLRAEFSDIRDAVQTWFADQWASQGFGPEGVSQRLKNYMDEALGRPVDAVLAELCSSAPPDGSSPKVMLEWLISIDDWVGRPANAASPATAGRIGDALLSAYRHVSDDWARRLIELTTSAIECPDYRVAGAEAAARAAIDAAGRMLAHFGPRSDEWLRQAADAKRHSEELLGLAERQSDLIKLGQSYAQARWQGLLIGRVAAVYQTVQSQLMTVFDQIAACRHQLEATHRFLTQIDAARQAADPTPESAGWLLPDDCRTVEDAVARIVQCISWDSARALDAMIQGSLQTSWGGFRKLCWTVSDAPQRLTALLNCACRQFLAPLVDESGAVDAFIGAHGGIEAAVEVLKAASDTAQPTLGSSDSAATLILELPPGHASVEFGRRTAAAIDSPVEMATGAVDSVVVIREQRDLKLSDIPQLGFSASEAFDLVCRADGIPPYSRMDIVDWASAEHAFR